MLIKIAAEKRLLAVFLLQTITNWMYVLWANSQPSIISSWIALSSLLGFIYFAFTIIAACGIYSKTKQGPLLGCCVILFGMISAVIAYSQAFVHYPLGETLIVLLIISNVCVIIYLAFSQTTCNKS